MDSSLRRHLQEMNYLKFMINHALLECWICHLPPKPHKYGSHMFLCNAGHVFCGLCMRSHMESYGVPLGFYNCCRVLEDIAPRIKVKCDCEGYFPYCRLKEHERECPSAKSSTPAAQRKCRVKMAHLSCSTCRVPLHPPVFKRCSGDDLVCSGCYRADTDNTYAHCTELEYLLKGMMVKCGNKNYGCKICLPYSRLTMHELDCPFRPTGQKIAPSGARKFCDEEETNKSPAGNNIIVGKTKGKAPSKVGKRDKHIVDRDEVENDDDSSDDIHDHGRPLFTEGGQIEVSRSAESFGESRNPATVLKVIGATNFLVQYRHVVEDGELITEIIDSQYIRPARGITCMDSKYRFPPSSHVEVFHEGSWWPGVILVSLGTDFSKKYVVKLKSHKTDMDDVEFEDVLTVENTQLRPRFDWNGRKWVHCLTMEPATKEHLLSSRKRPISAALASCNDSDEIRDRSGSCLDIVEGAAESTQMIKKLAITPLPSIDVSNSTEAETGNIQEDVEDSLAVVNLPFVKTFPLWAHVEAMEVFTKVPQQPNFHQLLQHVPISFHEGIALGLMVTFANLAESIKGLSIEHENVVFEEKMMVLSLLEADGFDVEDLRSRVETLLHMKNGCIELQHAKKLEEKIARKETDNQELGMQIGMLNGAVHQLELHASLLRNRMRSAVSEKLNNAVEISRLRMDATELERLYLSARQHFSSTAAAPW